MNVVIINHVLLRICCTEGMVVLGAKSGRFKCRYSYYLEMLVKKDQLFCIILLRRHLLHIGILNNNIRVYEQKALLSPTVDHKLRLNSIIFVVQTIILRGALK